jgi:hypothetical protein
MSATRFRRIARLERLATPYLEWKSGIEKEWERTLHGAAVSRLCNPLRQSATGRAFGVRNPAMRGSGCLEGVTSERSGSLSPNDAAV